MKLTPEQSNIISFLLENSGVTNQPLKDDLFDHLCCVVERNLQEGKTFDASLKEALQEVAPKGLDDVQRQTVRLLDSSQIFWSKKLMYSVGFLSSISLSLGWLFVTMRWPGGRELVNYGFLAFMLIFIPMLAIDRYRNSLQKALSAKLRMIIGTLSGIMLGVSLIFKVFHLQGADMLFIIGGVLFTFGFLPFLFFTLYKKAVAPAD